MWVHVRVWVRVSVCVRGMIRAEASSPRFNEHACIVHPRISAVVNRSCLATTRVQCAHAHVSVTGRWLFRMVGIPSVVGGQCAVESVCWSIGHLDVSLWVGVRFCVLGGWNTVLC